MPINIYKKVGFESIEFLCDHVWDLPTQLDSLEDWLKKTGKDLAKGNYVADIGFSVRLDASGGGGVVNSESMRIMGNIGMDIYLSEYSNSTVK